MSGKSPTPVALFAYARPDHLRRTLASLEANRVPLVYAFSDGPKAGDKVEAVSQVRALLRDIRWCEVILVERETNHGLGRSIREGVARVLGHHDRVLVFEDDLVCVPGTYQYLSAALEQYADDRKVMSVTGWTHPRVTPASIGESPYFDGRAECWVWGTWARAWAGMEQDAKAWMKVCDKQRVDVYRYGADLVEMAATEHERNIWAVRLLYLHIANRGLCLRPPWSMVEHIGFDSAATNFAQDDGWANPLLRDCPPIPATWPVARENPDCPDLWQKAYGARPWPRSLWGRVRGAVRRRLAAR